MNKFTAIKQLKSNGDSLVLVRGDDDYICVTPYFNTKHIRRKRSKMQTIMKNCVLVFSWSDDKFKQIKVSDIRNIIPLSKILDNEPYPEGVIVNG